MRIQDIYLLYVIKLYVIQNKEKNMKKTDFSKGAFFFDNYCIVLKDIEKFCTNKLLIFFIKHIQTLNTKTFTLNIMHKCSVANTRYAICYLTSKFGSNNINFEFHKYKNKNELSKLINEYGLIYIVNSNTDNNEKKLISNAHRHGLKIAWDEHDIREMLSFNDPFDPGKNNYFNARKHDKGRIWYAISEIDSDFVEHVRVGYGSKFYKPYISRSGNAKISIGRGSYISVNSRFFIDSDFTLGNFCQISADFTAITRRHAISNLSIGNIGGGGIGFFGEEEDLSKPIIVKNDVWIGTNVTVLPGVTIENGCVVGAGSVVTRDCEPYGIYAGNPAKLIRYRFSSKIIKLLQDSKWWGWPLKTIWENDKLFNIKINELDEDYIKDKLSQISHYNTTL
jgi:acetyltransferase-like isoleucine patch superfamily enzyme